jgi:serine/threonine protein kinase
MTLIRGVKVSSYEIVSAIGRGETGEVYLAKDLERDGNVAVKVMRDELASDPERFEQFETEARAASALQHPNIITIHDIGVHNSRPFVAMEYVEGRTLQEILLDGPLPIDELLSMAAQTADGLAEAHTAGIVHRELTPDNLMITEDGRVKILNFGLAALLSETTDQEADTNTKGYVSPEQAAGGEADYLPGERRRYRQALPSSTQSLKRFLIQIPICPPSCRLSWSAASPRIRMSVMVPRGT